MSWNFKATNFKTAMNFKTVVFKTTLAVTFAIFATSADLAGAGTRVPAWPMNLSPFQKGLKDCSKPSRPPAPRSPSEGPAARAYIDFLGEETCTVLKFRNQFMLDANRFCPSVRVVTFGDCYRKVLDAWLGRPGLESTGFALMESMATSYFSLHQESFNSKAEALLEGVEIQLDTLDRLKKRTRPEQLLKKGARASAAKAGVELRKLRKMDRESAKKFADSSLERADLTLLQVEGGLKDQKSGLSEIEMKREQALRSRLTQFQKAGGKAYE